MYALAASAAGVSALALSQPAAARIVYTPIHHVIGKNASFYIDLNHDGIADFLLVNSAFRVSHTSVNLLRALRTTTSQQEWPEPFAHRIHSPLWH
jgi:hypothetical protein